jgi:DNA-binding Lrp family transcriptional regulator
LSASPQKCRINVLSIENLKVISLFIDEFTDKREGENLKKKEKNFYIFPTANNKFKHAPLHIERREATVKLKNNTLILDDTDLEILEALQEDSRQTYMAIGKLLGIAHSTVYDRIKRMEKNGIIKKYTALIDSEKAGTKSVTAIMTVFTDPKESEKVAETLSSAPQVLEVYTSLSEELQIIAKVAAENQESLHTFIADSVAPLPGVLRIRTSMLTKKFKETQFSVVNNPKKLTFIKETHNIKGREIV